MQRMGFIERYDDKLKLWSKIPFPWEKCDSLHHLFLDQVPDIARDPGSVRADGAAGLPGPALPQLDARLHRGALCLPGKRVAESVLY